MTNSYFEKIAIDGATDKEVHIDVGTTNFAENGPQMYVQVGDGHVILSPEDAKAFCKAVAGVAHYFGYEQDK